MYLWKESFQKWLLIIKVSFQPSLEELVKTIELSWHEIFKSSLIFNKNKSFQLKFKAGVKLRCFKLDGQTFYVKLSVPTKVIIYSKASQTFPNILWKDFPLRRVVCLLYGPRIRTYNIGSKEILFCEVVGLAVG